MKLKSHIPISLSLVIAVSVAVMVVAAAVQLCCGAYPIALGDVWMTLTGGAVTDNERVAAVVVNLRLPRVVAGLFVGVNLALAGAVFQAITRNEMASPYLLGVSHGAGLVAMLTLVLFPAAVAFMPALAMLGGIAAFLVVYAVAWRHGTSPVRLVLAGVIVGAVVGSVQMVLRFLIEDLETLSGALNWMAGSLTGSDWSVVKRVAPWSVLSTALILFGARDLDLMALGDEKAKSLGMRVEDMRFVLATAAILASASAVSAAGLVGFVGLLAPHIVRSLVGSSHARLLTGCLFVGPALLMGSDAIARLAFSPLQLPVGVVTGLIGGVFFLILMRRRLNAGGGRV